MDALLSPKPASSSHDILCLRKIYDAVDIHTRTLVPFNINMDHYGTMLVSVLLNKLLEEIKKILSVFSRERFSSIFRSSKNNYSGEYPASVLLPHRNKETQTQISCTYCRMAHQNNRCHIIIDMQASNNFLRGKSKSFNCINTRSNYFDTFSESKIAVSNLMSTRSN